MCNLKKTRLTKLLGYSLVLLCSVTNASELNFGTRTPTVQELVDHLAPRNAAPAKKYRGIVFKNEMGSKPVAEHKQQPQQTQLTQQSLQPETEQEQEPNAASLQIQFAFDSSEITDAAIQQLHPLGMALKSTDLAGLSFVLEGHTDGVGSTAYNRSLSKRRALAIKHHLMANYEIPGEHLQAVGLGESALLVPNQPDAAENRRVRIASNGTQ